MTVPWLVMILSVLFFWAILEMIRRERLTFKYAAGWLTVALAGFLCSADDRLLRWAAASLGFELLSNFVFFVVLCALVFLSLFLTILLCQQNERNDRLAQRVGLLENALRRVRRGHEENPADAAANASPDDPVKNP